MEILYRLYCRHKPFRNICQKSIKHSDEKHNNFVFVNALSLRYENENIASTVAGSMEIFLDWVIGKCKQKIYKGREKSN